jgi:hypothetical protein
VTISDIMLGVDISWVDEIALVPASVWNIQEVRMNLTTEQYIAMGNSAMQALISKEESFLFPPDEIATRAWDIADAMAKQLSARGNKDMMSGTAKLGDAIPPWGATPFAAMASHLKTPHEALMTAPEKP